MIVRPAYHRAANCVHAVSYLCVLLAAVIMLITGKFSRGQSYAMTDQGICLSCLVLNFASLIELRRADTGSELSLN